MRKLSERIEFEVVSTICVICFFIAFSIIQKFELIFIFGLVLVGIQIFRWFLLKKERDQLTTQKIDDDELRRHII
jgi:hypothetical protein